jgi:N-acetylglutamate synthase-like GNAT family acetyltransferase
MAVKFTEKLTDQSTVYIRPVNRGDVERERSFVDGLSKQSKYFRFLGGISHLTEDELQRFCDVDHKHEMAFVALARNASEDMQVGVARYVADLDTREAEIAVTVADDWQDKGLDEILLRHLIDYARSCGIERLYSIELAINTQMHDLARKCGFEVTSDPNDATQVINRLDLAAGA